MKTALNSMKELITHCSAGGLTTGFPRTLALDRTTDWKLISGIIHHNECQAQFVSCPEPGKPAFLISWKSSYQGEYGNIELLDRAI